MELYKQMFADALTNGKIQVTFALSESAFAELMENQCYRALEKIRDILADDHLSDEDCFERIEAIVCAIEEIGGFCGSRHDFG